MSRSHRLSYSQVTAQGRGGGRGFRADCPVRLLTRCPALTRHQTGNEAIVTGLLQGDEVCHTVPGKAGKCPATWTLTHASSRARSGFLWHRVGPKCSRPHRASLTFRGCRLNGVPGHGLLPAEAASLRGPVPSAPWSTAGGQRWALARRAGLKHE